MSCLLKYRWVKLPRALVPSGKGILGSWARLAARAAFRAGHGRYCGHMNAVTPGMWAGGIVGVKSILGVRRRGDALNMLDELQNLGYITYTLDPATKKLEYHIRDWVLEFSGEGCSYGAVYATDGYGFICLPRNMMQTHGWTSGATLCGGRTAMRFHIWRPRCSSALWAPRSLWKLWGGAGAGKRPRYGDSCISTGMPSLCTVCPAQAAASSLINST